MQGADWFKLVSAIALCEFVGVLGSFFTFPAIGTWYANLAKPFFTPPNWVFGPIWILLYALMGIALFLVWRKKPEKSLSRKADGIFALQLLLNAAWSILFFGLHLLLVSFIEIVLLWLSILATILVFRKISTTAAWLLVPYLAWVSVAAALNLAVWLLNP